MRLFHDPEPGWAAAGPPAPAGIKGDHETMTITERKRGPALTYLFLFMTSFSVLTLEIVYARIFSVLTYYHFTSMIISVALLGFGAAGASISLRFRKERMDEGFLGSSLLFFFGSILFSFYLIIKIGFYPLEWNADWTNQLTLVFFYLILGLPFFFGGRVISGLFSLYPERANALYFFDLVGAGLGSLSVVVLFEVLSAPLILHVLALLGFLLLLPAARFGRRVRLGALACLLLAGLFTYKLVVEKPILVYPPPSKAMFQYAPPWKGSGSIEYSKWNVIERVDVTKPLTRNVWGFGGEISSLFDKDEIELRYIFKDGILSSGIIKVDKPLEDYPFLGGYIMAAPYHLSAERFRSTVVIGPGGGIDILIALYHRVSNVIGVELNPEKVRLLEKRYYQYSGRLKDRCTLVPWEGRHFLSRYKSKVDVITTSGLDDYPALSSGSYALSENYIFTVEAVNAMLDRLTERGVISMIRVGFDPPREEFKLVTTMREALARAGAQDPSKHFAIVRGGLWVNIMLKKIPFESGEISRLKDWAGRMRFGFLYLPDEPQDNPVDRYLRLPPSRAEAFLKDYPYKVSPARDDAPFFFQYYKWGSLFARKSYRWVYDQLVPLGMQIAFFSLLQVTLLGILFIAVPLGSLKLGRRRAWVRPLIYFGALGFGFILIEIVLIQKLNYFLGGAVYALAVTLFALLTFSGLGSYFVRKKEVDRFFLIRVIGAVMGLCLIYLVGLNGLLGLLMPLGRTLRIAATAVILAPLGFVMGIPFPSGIRMLKARSLEMIVPWCWGVNSIFTVFGSVFSLIVSLNWGFNLTLLLGIAAYGVALAGVSVFFPGRKEVGRA